MKPKIDRFISWMNIVKTKIYERPNVTEFISYIIAGVLTTVINFTIYFGMIKIWDTYYQTANAIAFFISVLFSYFINKAWVFKIKRNRHLFAFLDLIAFSLSRISVLFLELTLLFLMISICEIDTMTSKIVTNIIVVAANYLLGKKFVFAPKG